MLRISLLTLALFAPSSFAQDFKLPPGFEISEYAGDALASDIFSMTIDPKGRLIVSGKNYIRILVDDKGAGKANRAIEFATEPKTGAHGMLWEGDTLLFVGDAGLCKLTDKNGDDKADGPATLIRPMKTGNDHTAHALRRGPDGWLYLLAGDQAGIDDSFVQLPTSPVKNPIAGTVVRFHPTSGKSEIVAHGLRNPYGFDFDAHGRLFTYDSDNERCIGMPWYEGTRLYQIVEGAYYGWLGPQFSSRMWRIPPYAPDTMAPLATFGRGSPTFVVAAVSTPDSSTLLLGDWTFGRVHRAVMPVSSLTQSKDPTVFLEPSASSSFAPTAAAIHPKTGDVFFATGGRGTRGAVYRVRGFAPPAATLKHPPLATENVKDANAEIARGAVDANPLARLRALERGARRQPDDMPPILDATIKAALEANWDTSDRVLAFAAARAASENPKVTFKRDGSLLGLRTDLLAKILAGESFDPAVALPLLEAKSEELIVDGLCLIQRRLELPAEPGPAWEGYAGSVAPESRKALTPALVKLLERTKADGGVLQREAARTFGLVVVDEPATRVVSWLKSTANPTDAFHFLAVLAHCGPKLAEGETAAIAKVLLGIDRAYRKSDIPRESNWRTRFGELLPMLFKRDPKLAKALLEHGDFGAPEHAALAFAAGFPREQAIPIFRAKVAGNPEYPLDARVLALLDEIPGEEIAAVVRPYFGKAGLDEAILPFLARKPKAEDRGKFVNGLRSLQPKTVQMCVQALNALKLPGDDDEVLNLVTAWDQAGDKQAILTAAIVDRLQTAAHIKLGGNRSAWRDVLEIQRPNIAKRLAQVDNVDRHAWQKRLDAIDWSKGDIDRGKAYFVKANCAACHSGTQTVGPDLVGSAGRFNRDDLFTAILQPNKDVSDRYRLTQVVTNDGKVHLGIIIYTAFDGVILRTGLADTVRIPGSNIESQTTVVRSLMPAGLIDAATDGNLADLYTYLQALK